MELAMAKMKDQMSLLDVNIIPKGWSTDKWLDYLDLTGIGFAVTGSLTPFVAAVIMPLSSVTVVGLATFLTLTKRIPPAEK
jgi:predicted membrane channel-forming protein YqfA (hemolysin III family)